MTTMKRAAVVGLLLGVSASAACAPSSAPRPVAPDATAPGVRMAAAVAAEFDDMVAVGIGVSSNAENVYAISANLLFSVNDEKYRIAPLEVDEAAFRAGGATQLVAALERAGGSGLLTQVLAGIPGAIPRASPEETEQVVASAEALGPGVSFATVAEGIYGSKADAERKIISQLHGLYLGEQTLAVGEPIAGFVFYPKDTYIEVRAVLIDQATGRVTEVAGPMLDRRPATVREGAAGD